MTDFLNSDAMRVVERNDKGNVTYRKRYKRGDEVDVSHIDDAQVENLRNKGVLVDSEEKVAERGQAPAPVPGSQLTGAATGEAADHSEIVDDESEYEDDETGEDEEEVEDGEVVDDYSEMDYTQLQQAAGAKGIKTNQSAAALREALRNS